ncbi:hypothetical protein LINPERHAP1_LOCUS3634 [Linum perenne]
MKPRLKGLVTILGGRSVLTLLRLK